MKRYFVCLANSKKYSGRCVAGVELTPKQYSKQKFEVKVENNRPYWIRPISEAQFGQIDEHLVSQIRLLDILEIEVINNCPQGFQTENVTFEQYSIKVIENVPAQSLFLDKLVNPMENEIFRSQDICVPVKDIGQLNYSLTFIKPDSWHCYLKDRSVSLQDPQVRFKFTYKGLDYNFPVTDIDFCERYLGDNSILDFITDIYLTISLGMQFNANHYKLIAGVVCSE